MKAILFTISIFFGIFSIVSSQSVWQNLPSNEFKFESKKFYSIDYSTYKNELEARRTNHKKNNAGTDNFSQWNWQNILPQGNNLNSITYALSPFNKGAYNHGYAVGNYGTVVKSTDGGIFWFDISSNMPSQTRLTAVSFINNNTGLASGEDGYIYKTTNGGDSWDFYLANNFTQLKCVQMLNSNDAYCCQEDGVILYSNDGGETWVEQADFADFLFSIQFYDINTGIAVGSFDGNGLIVNTTDAGATWTDVTPAISLFALRGIDFVDSATAYVVGDLGKIAKTTNGGLNWTSQTSGITEPLYGVSFYDSNQGWAVGGGFYFSSKVLHTNDGGDTWDESNFQTFVPINSVYATGYNLATFCGNGGLIFRSYSNANARNNGSYDYERLVSGADASVFACDFVNESTGYGVGNPGFAFGGSVYKTTNGGINWTNPPSGVFTFMLDVDFLDEYTGYMGGGGGFFYKTTNGALTWEQQSLGTDQTIDGLEFINNTGIVVTDSGRIFRTTDGGTNWTQQSSGTFNDLNGVSMPSLNSIYVCGNNGTILKSVNQGVTWTAQSSGLFDAIEQVFFINDNTGWAVAGFNSIIKTTNGGSNWNALLPSPDIFFPNDIIFLNANTGFIGNAFAGTVSKSTDGGDNWNIFGTAPLYDGYIGQIAPVSENTCYAVGTEGAIMKFGTGGSATLVLNISATTEGLVKDCLYYPDTITTILRSDVSPYIKIDSGKRKMDDFDVQQPMIVSFYNATPGDYYVVLSHRNSIETWSSTPLTFAAIGDGYTILYDENTVFDQNVAFTCPGFYGLYSGDVNQDGIIDGTDFLEVDNDAFAFATGYIATDLNNDLITDGTDFSIVDGNAANSIYVHQP